MISVAGYLSGRGGSTSACALTHGVGLRRSGTRWDGEERVGVDVQRLVVRHPDVLCEGFRAGHQSGLGELVTRPPVEGGGVPPLLEQQDLVESAVRLARELDVHEALVLPHLGQLLAQQILEPPRVGASHARGQDPNDHAEQDRVGRAPRNLQIADDQAPGDVRSQTDCSSGPGSDQPAASRPAPRPCP